MKEMGLALLLCVCCIGGGTLNVYAQEEFLGRSFAAVKEQYRQVPVVARVRVTDAQFVLSGFLELYKVEAEVLEVFKGKISGRKLVYYFSLEKGNEYYIPQMAGTARIIFLEKQYRVPDASGKRWFELESSALPASKRLNYLLHKLKKR